MQNVMRCVTYVLAWRVHDDSVLMWQLLVLLQRDWYAPIVADAEAGFGGPLNVFELMKAMIRAGAGGVHLEDQLSSEKKCGHLGGKVLAEAHAILWDSSLSVALLCWAGRGRCIACNDTLGSIVV